MRKKTLYIIISILLFCAMIYVGGKVVLPFLIDYIGGIDREYINKMKSIKEGVTEQEVVKILGQPDEVITKPEETLTYLKNAGVQEYEKKMKRFNKRLIYFHGIDYMGSYLIDNEGKVYFVDVGGT